MEVVEVERLAEELEREVAEVDGDLAQLSAPGDEPRLVSASGGSSSPPFSPHLLPGQLLELSTELLPFLPVR